MRQNKADWVLAANLHHKNEMVAYLRTVSTTSIAKTTEEQREIVQKLIREAVSKEITVLKKVLSESSANHRVPFLSSWGRIIICCSLTALIGSAITVELIQRLGITWFSLPTKHWFSTLSLTVWLIYGLGLLLLRFSASTIFAWLTPPDFLHWIRGSKP